jgi:hypothetical protein
MSRKHVHGRNYRRLAPLVVRYANTNPRVTCHRCGMTIDKCKPHRNGKLARWTAGHLHDGQLDITLTLADLAPECSSCNYSSGASFGNRQRVEPRTLRWR